MEVEWERERERGGAWMRRGVARCHVSVEDGGVGTTRVDVADRWAGTLWGPDHQWLGPAQGSVVR
jgi:hypothetical protein